MDGPKRHRMAHRVFVNVLAEMPVERRWRFLLTVLRLIRRSGWHYHYRGDGWVKALRQWNERRRADPAPSRKAGS